MPEESIVLVGTEVVRFSPGCPVGLFSYFSYVRYTKIIIRSLATGPPPQSAVNAARFTFFQSIGGHYTLVIRYGRYRLGSHGNKAVPLQYTPGHENWNVINVIPSCLKPHHLSQWKVVRFGPKAVKSWITFHDQAVCIFDNGLCLWGYTVTLRFIPIYSHYVYASRESGPSNSYKYTTTTYIHRKYSKYKELVYLYLFGSDTDWPGLAVAVCRN